MYAVETDEELFTRFKEMELKLRGISRYFQNDGTEMTYKETLEWQKEYTQFYEEVGLLLIEADSRIKLKN